MKLNARQQRFVEEYLVDLNGTQAAIRAGYSEKTAPSQASRLLTNANIMAALQAARARLAKKLEVTQERVLQELARIAFADVRDLFTWDEQQACYVPSTNLTDDQAAAIASIEAETMRFTREDGLTETKIKLKLKTYDKKGALDSLAKHLGMFIERHEHTGKDGGPMEHEVHEARERVARRVAGIALRRRANGSAPVSNGNGAHGP